MAGRPLEVRRAMTLSQLHGHVLALMAVAVPPLAVFASKGLAPLAVGGAVALATAQLAMTRTLPKPPPWLVGILGAVVVWAAFSALWSLDPGNTLRKDARLLGSLLAGLVLFDAARNLDRDGRDSLEWGMIAAALLAFALVGFEVATNCLVSRMIHGQATLTWSDYRGEQAHSVFVKNAASVCALMAWPSALMIGRRFGPCAMWLSLVVALALVAPTHASTAATALAIGLAVFAVARSYPRLVAVLIGGALVIAVAAMPLVPRMLPPPERVMAAMPEFVPDSFRHRLRIWAFVAEHIAERPLTGWGLDSSRSIPGGSVKTWTVVEIPGRPTHTHHEEPLPLHPHNNLLQWWLELGLPGAVLAATLVVTILRRIIHAPLDRDGTAASLALLATGLFIANSSYGAFQNWWVGVEWLAAAFVAGAVARPER